jgi:hypothetical protein
MFPLVKEGTQPSALSSVHCILLFRISVRLFHMRESDTYSEEEHSSFAMRISFVLPMAELVYLTFFTVLSGALNTQSARQTPKYCFLVGHVCCMRNIPQYRLSPAEYRQTKPPSSYQLHHLVLRHLSQVVRNPPCSGFEPGTSRTRVRRSNHYTIELYCNANK